MEKFSELTTSQKYIAALAWLEDDVYPDAFMEWARCMVNDGSHTLDLESVAEWYDEQCELNEARFDEGKGTLVFVALSSLSEGDNDE
jgi:hypothetical protein